MKKKWVSVLLLVIFGLSVVNILKVSADWSVSPRLWYANWDLGHTDRSGFMYGVSASYSLLKLASSLRKFDIGFSMLVGDFDVESHTDESNFTRSDIDLYLSYKLFDPYLSLVVGYKSIQWKEKVIPMDVKAKGFGLGASGAIHIKDDFFGYYIASILPSMVAEFDIFNEFETDVKSINIELGAGYIITDKFTIALGWKNQLFDWEEKYMEQHTVSGLTAVANFKF